MIDDAHIKRERQKARDLRQTQWWKAQIASGVCHYCKKKFPRQELTMDHVVPLAKGGTSSRSNIVPACKSCNTDKKAISPVDEAFAALEQEKTARERKEHE